VSRLDVTVKNGQISVQKIGSIHSLVFSEVSCILCGILHHDNCSLIVCVCGCAATDGNQAPTNMRVEGNHARSMIWTERDRNSNGECLFTHYLIKDTVIQDKTTIEEVTTTLDDMAVGFAFLKFNHLTLLRARHLTTEYNYEVTFLHHLGLNKLMK